MLGKACYEGIVVEVPFAHFFLNAMIGRVNTLDELPSLDPDLARNLQFVRHYEGDVEDLDLTFAVDEEEFGKMVSKPLIPGGSVTNVTNSNKIYYLFQMAHYRLNRTLKQQLFAHSAHSPFFCVQTT
eukprot:m.190146 g.190146  ORF g.190146 m.190146 type:complete len:127 (+) comp25682_c0_seq8:2453-2833(+)